MVLFFNCYKKIVKIHPTKLFAILLVVNLFGCISEKQKPFKLDKKKLKIDSVYLAFRGTNTKQGFFAKDFNIRDTSSSHVGLLLNIKNTWKVFHVSDFNDVTSDLKCENVDVFFDVEKEKIIYAGIWGINQISDSNLIVLKNELNLALKKKIKFDKSFELNNSNKLYCSEFVNLMLLKIDPYKFNIPLNKRVLKGIYKQYFQKDSLIYYSVDAFHFNNNFYKINDWHIK